MALLAAMAFFASSNKAFVCLDWALAMRQTNARQATNSSFLQFFILIIGDLIEEN
jgi:hypothetical protein